MIDEEEFKGKPVFEVSFLDFCKIATRTERRTKFTLENQKLLEHIKATRYSKNYFVEFNGILVDASMNEPKQE